MHILCVCLLVSALPVYAIPLPNTQNGGMKEKFREFLRKVVYGITPTTIYTTLKPWRFPEEYDPVRVLEWQLKEEKRLGITTPDFDPPLTDVTNLWDGFWNDPTIDDITFWCMRHMHANDSAPTTVKRYWESDWGHDESIEAIAKYWHQEALKENSEWWATVVTKKYVPFEDLTADSQDSWRCSPNWESDPMDSSQKKLVEQVQQIKDDQYQKKFAKYNYNYSPRSNQEEELKATHRGPKEPHKATHPTHPTTEAPQEGESTAKPVKRPATPIIQGRSDLEPDTESEYISVDGVKRNPR